MPWFHGGVPGLASGDTVLPPTATGFDARRKDGEAAGLAAHGRVFVTREPGLAASYAASYPHGDVYQVGPVGPLGDDPDVLIMHDAIKWCATAVVVRVTRRAVRRLPDGTLTRAGGDR